MLLDQETLRFVFGLKLRTFRKAKGLSLQELAAKTGISSSYLNEIEKGKKYPKPDKIALLAESLNIPYDELISLKLRHDLHLLSQMLHGNILRGLPFDIFGIPRRALLEWMAEKPEEIGALVGTVLEVIRNFQLGTREFFDAALCAYLDLHDNYLEDIEREVREFKKSHLKEPTDVVSKTCSDTRALKDLLYSMGVRVEERDFGEFPKELHTLYSLYRPSLLILNSRVDDREKRFILAREIGFKTLNLKERLPSSAAVVENFSELMNNLKAAYFASSLLIPEKPFAREISDFFSRETWNPTHFVSWMMSYPGTTESFFHRLSQLLPRYFGINELFYLRVRFNTVNRRFRLSRDLHLSSHHGPHKARENEHYCRRWVTTNLLKKAETAASFPLIDTQRSRFFGSSNEYLCFSVANPSPVNSERRIASTLGILVTPKAQKTIRFLEDPSIPSKEVSDTCERCGLENCTERAADPVIFDQVQRVKRTQEAIREVVVS